jgi:two-component system NarL family sensor kinase
MKKESFQGMSRCYQWWLKIQRFVLRNNPHHKTCFLISGIFAVVMTLEYATPPDYVFGYLYTGPILLANPGLNRLATFQVTLFASGLTLFNLVFPHLQHIALLSL